MSDQECITAIRKFLQSAFPEAEIHDWKDPELHAHAFRVEEHGSIYLTAVADEFLGKLETGQITSRLSQLVLVEHMRDLPETLVVVTNEGLKLQYE